MDGDRIDLRGAQATTLLTLYLRAVDARSARPILGDRWAVDVMDRVDRRADTRGFALARSDAPTIACRGRTLDTWAREFLGEHPDGQVLHLGCGLDSRPLRISRPAASRWIDIDQPDVIALRRKVYALPPDVETVAASVTDPDWWSVLDADRPTLAVAEGVLPYLAEAEVHELVDRLVAHTRGGILVFDGIAPWAVAVAGRTPTFQRMGAALHWAYRADAFAARHPGLVRRDAVGVLGLVAEAAPQAWIRVVSSALRGLPPMRDAMQTLRYTWSENDAPA